MLDAAGDVRRSGTDSRQSLERMGILVGAAFVAVPVMLVLPVYLPLRLAWRREVAAVRTALQSADAASLDLLLARRALVTLPLRGGARPGTAPPGELSAEETRRLADAELARLGLSPSLAELLQYVAAAGRPPGGHGGDGRRRYAVAAVR